MAKKAATNIDLANALGVLAAGFKTEVGYSSCFVFCSQPMVCPFCRTTVQANTEHRCERKS